MKNKFIKGASVLTLSALLAKLLGAIYRIPLSNILGAEGIGVYQMVFPIYSLLLVFASGGIPLALSKKISEARAKRNYAKINHYFYSALLICAALASGFALLLFLLSKPLAFLQGNENATLAYMGIAVATFFSCLIPAYRGYFQGHENMTPTAISSVIEQITKLVLGFLFAVWWTPKGLAYGVFGAVLGMAIGEILSFIYLFFVFDLNKRESTKKLIKEDSQSLFSLALPLTLSSLALPLSLAVDSLLVVNFLKGYLPSETATALYGLQTGMVNPLVNFPTIIVASLCTALLPTICYYIKSNKLEQKDVLVSKTFKFAWCFILGCVAGYLALAPQIIQALFSTSLDFTSLQITTRLFVISSFGMLFMALGQVCSTILTAESKPYKPAINMGIAVGLKTLLVIILTNIPAINIYGFAIASVISYAVFALLNVVSATKICPIMTTSRHIMLPFVLAIMMGIGVFYLARMLGGINIFVNLITCIVVGFSSYLLLLCSTKVFNFKEITSLVSFKKLAKPKN